MHRRAPKGSGGVGVFIKDSLFRDYIVKMIDKSVEGVIGLSVKHNKSEFTLLVYSCYLPSENSPWGRDAVGFYAHLLSKVYAHDEVNGIMFCGDFNARVGDLKDYIEDKDLILERKSTDKTVNVHNKALIEFLEESKYCIQVN